MSETIHIMQHTEQELEGWHSFMCQRCGYAIMINWISSEQKIIQEPAGDRWHHHVAAVGMVYVETMTETEEPAVEIPQAFIEYLEGIE